MKIFRAFGPTLGKGKLLKKLILLLIIQLFLKKMIIVQNYQVKLKMKLNYLIFL